MWLRNTDKEVECFHPVCAEALNKALDNLKLSDKYKVTHHRYVGSIEMDLVVENRADNKILCVIEVKRTITAVNSTRYQFQAMSYVQSLRENELESKYYILTDLEASCLFKFDINRPSPYEQIIEPGIKVIHKFADVSRETFMEDLVAQYQEYLSLIISDSGKYLLTFQSFANEIEDNLGKELKWKKSLVCLFYEYIRGSFTKINRGRMKTIPQLSNKVDLICREGSSINFKDIFTLPDLPNNEKNVETNSTLLQQLFELGKTYVDADELASVMHRVISDGHEHEGEVPTDTELANLMMWLVRSVGGTLKPDERIFDPAAGSGSLLSAAVSVFDGIQPSQLQANDINKNLLQLLSLRLGLKFPSTIGKNNTTSITAQNIADLDPASFEGVKYIVMNPPYLAATGKNCVERKNELYRRIKEIKNVPATTIGGQMPLEGVFVELVSVLAKKGTVIAAILPNTHFTTKGDASIAIRKMLLEDFGLQLIFNYPQENLFEDVVQNTSIVVGVKGTRSQDVKILYCNQVVTEVDASNLSSILSMPLINNEIENINDEFEGCLLSRQSLIDSITEGWRVVNKNKQQALSFIDQYITTSEYLIPLSKSEFSKYKRGETANNGCVDLLFLKKRNSFLKTASNFLKGHLAPGLNNAKFDKMDVGDGESYFFDVRNMSDEQIMNVINLFLAEKKNVTKKQQKKPKTAEDYFKILKKESKFIHPAFCVMLPRNLRANGSVYVTTKPTYISTNFFIIEADSRGAKILSSWFTTIFYQLECEVYGNNYKGARKLEEKDYESLYVPSTIRISEKYKLLICNTPIDNFINLRNPEPREIDKVWAEILFGKDADERLYEASNLLAILAANREY